VNGRCFHVSTHYDISGKRFRRGQSSTTLDASRSMCPPTVKGAAVYSAALGGSRGGRGVSGGRRGRHPARPTLRAGRGKPPLSILVPVAGGMFAVPGAANVHRDRGRQVFMEVGRARCGECPRSLRHVLRHRWFAAPRFTGETSTLPRPATAPLPRMSQAPDGVRRSRPAKPVPIARGRNPGTRQGSMPGKRFQSSSGVEPLCAGRCTS
jgi:hypothetical protein